MIRGGLGNCLVCARAASINAGSLTALPLHAGELQSRPLFTEAAVAVGGIGAAIAICRNSVGEISKRRLSADAPEAIPRQLATLRTGDFHNQVAGAVGTPIFMFGAMVIAQVLNRTTVEGHEYIRKYCWGRHERITDRPLGVLTVSNHRCLWDGLALGMLMNPLSHWFDRKRFHWTVGDLDIMFNNKITATLGAIVKVVPVARGNRWNGDAGQWVLREGDGHGLMQPCLRGIHELLCKPVGAQPCEWVHMFPEGGIHPASAPSPPAPPRDERVRWVTASGRTNDHGGRGREGGEGGEGGEGRTNDPTAADGLHSGADGTTAGVPAAAGVAAAAAAEDTIGGKVAPFKWGVGRLLARSSRVVIDNQDEEHTDAEAHAPTAGDNTSSTSSTSSAGSAGSAPTKGLSAGGSSIAGVTVLPIYHTLDDLSPATGRVDIASLLPVVGKCAVVRVGAPGEEMLQVQMRATIDPDRYNY
jgi:1-acyl-sn-glycerol-3-phosphate acyltransferase